MDDRRQYEHPSSTQTHPERPQLLLQVFHHLPCSLAGLEKSRENHHLLQRLMGEFQAGSR